MTTPLTSSGQASTNRIFRSMAAVGMGGVAIFDHIKIDNDNHSDSDGQATSNVTDVQSLPIPEPFPGGVARIEQELNG